MDFFFKFGIQQNKGIPDILTMLAAAKMFLPAGYPPLTGGGGLWLAHICHRNGDSDILHTQPAHITHHHPHHPLTHSLTLSLSFSHPNKLNPFLLHFTRILYL